MSASPANPNPTDVKLLPGSAAAGGAIIGSSASTAGASAAVVSSAGATSPAQPARQFSDLPKDELDPLAEEFGLDSSRYKNRQQLIAAIHDRRQMIAAMDREAMLDVV